MSQLPQTYYRSEAARQLAERVESGEGLKSLNVTVNIDTILPNRNEEVISKVQQAIEENSNFVLYADEKRYILIIPCKLVVACYVDGKQETFEQMNDMLQFQNRIKIAFVVYDKFYRIDRCVESGGNGNEPISLHPTGKNLSDGEAGTGKSEAGISQ